MKFKIALNVINVINNAQNVNSIRIIVQDVMGLE